MKHTAKHFVPFAATLMVAGQAFAKSSVPQMDPSSFPNQLFWLVVTFGALYLIISKSVVPTVSEVLSAREATIADAIAKAEAFKQHAEKTKGDFEAGSTTARAKAAEMLAKAQADAAAKQAEAMTALNAMLETQSAKSAAALQKTVAAAKKDLDLASADLARAIAEKLLGSKVDEASVKAALKNAA